MKDPLTSLFNTARPEEPNSLQVIEYDSFIAKLKEASCKDLQSELDRYLLLNASNFQIPRFICEECGFSK